MNTKKLIRVDHLDILFLKYVFQLDGIQFLLVTEKVWDENK